MVPRIRVAIIGGGPSGLLVCRHLSAEPDVFASTVFEQTDAIGGTWVYTDRTGTDDNGLPVHTSMYKNLRVNLPKELMAFSDFPFPIEGSSYPSHEEVLLYLQNYCNHFQLLNFIRFCTKVICVKPLTSTEPQLWSVEVENVKTKEKEIHEFDKIVVANGHYFRPRHAGIPGLEAFVGTVIHSHSYRVPDAFTGRNVACIGGRMSGIDISIEVASVARKVQLCHDCKVITAPLPSNLEQLPWPASADAHGLKFKDGRYFRADDIILCTGYEYAFDFLDPSCGISVVDHRVTPLYKHLVHCERPSMAIMCVIRGVAFNVVDVQAQFLAKVFKDPNSILPTTKEMTLDTEAELLKYISEGREPKYFHLMLLRVWEYLNDLVKIAGLNPIPISREKLHRICVDDRLRNLCTFRDYEYSVTDTDVFPRNTVGLKF